MEEFPRAATRHVFYVGYAFGAMEPQIGLVSGRSGRVRATRGSVILLRFVCGRG